MKNHPDFKYDSYELWLHVPTNLYWTSVSEEHNLSWCFKGVIDEILIQPINFSFVHKVKHLP